jgi:hypothetical protein
MGVPFGVLDSGGKSRENPCVRSLVTSSGATFNSREYNHPDFKSLKTSELFVS